MFIKYDEYELLELFTNEPIVVAEKETGMFIYKKDDMCGIEIVLSISVYEKKCGIALSLEERMLFEIELDNVKYLTSDGKCLRIHQSNSIHNYLIYFEPTLFIKVERF